MYDSGVGQIAEPGQYLLNDGRRLIVGHQLIFLMFFEESHQIASFAVLSNDVAVVAGHKHIVALDEVGVVELLEDIHLAFEHFAISHSVLFEVDDFDGEDVT